MYQTLIISVTTSPLQWNLILNANSSKNIIIFNFYCFTSHMIRFSRFYQNNYLCLWLNKRIHLYYNNNQYSSLLVWTHHEEAYIYNNNNNRNLFITMLFHYDSHQDNVKPGTKGFKSHTLVWRSVCAKPGCPYGINDNDDTQEINTKIIESVYNLFTTMYFYELNKEHICLLLKLINFINLSLTVNGTFLWIRWYEVEWEGRLCWELANPFLINRQI